MEGHFYDLFAQSTPLSILQPLLYQSEAKRRELGLLQCTLGSVAPWKDYCIVQDSYRTTDPRGLRNSSRVKGSFLFSDQEKFGTLVQDQGK